MKRSFLLQIHQMSELYFTICFLSIEHYFTPQLADATIIAVVKVSLSMGFHSENAHVLVHMNITSGKVIT